MLLDYIWSKHTDKAAVNTNMKVTCGNMFLTPLCMTEAAHHLGHMVAASVLR